MVSVIRRIRWAADIKPAQDQRLCFPGVLLFFKRYRYSISFEILLLARIDTFRGSGVNSRRKLYPEVVRPLPLLEEVRTAWWFLLLLSVIISGRNVPNGVYCFLALSDWNSVCGLSKFLNGNWIAFDFSSLDFNFFRFSFENTAPIYGGRSSSVFSIRLQQFFLLQQAYLSTGRRLTVAAASFDLPRRLETCAGER
jgi:hypothetical protein